METMKKICTAGMTCRFSSCCWFAEQGEEEGSRHGAGSHGDIGPAYGCLCWSIGRLQASHGAAQENTACGQAGRHQQLWTGQSAARRPLPHAVSGQLSHISRLSRAAAQTRRSASSHKSMRTAWKRCLSSSSQRSVPPWLASARRTRGSGWRAR